MAAVAAAMVAGPSIAGPGTNIINISAEERLGRRHAAYELASPRYRRSKGPQAKPKRRPNRLTIGKRVRRKHRRAGR